MVKHICLIVACVMGLAQPVWAQHPCDTTPASITTIPAGQSFTLGMCHSERDTAGVTITGLTYRLYRNSALVTTTPMIGATVNAQGLRYVTWVRSEGATGTVQFTAAAVTTSGVESARSSFVSLAVTPAPQVAVPSVVGLTQASAQAALVAATFVVGPVTQQSSAIVPSGVVISQNPIAGALAPGGSVVAFVVSSGPPPVQVVVPSVAGLTTTAAQATLVTVGLTLGTQTLQSSITIAVGLIINQTPLAGLQASVGSSVTIVVSSGPPPPAPSTIGLTTIGGSLDTGNANWLTGSIVTTLAGGTVTSMSVHVGALDSSMTNRLYQLAIYTNNGGRPGTLIASSASGTLAANAWNTVPINATLQASTSYWLLYNTNGNSSTVNEMHYNVATTGQGVWSSQAFAFGTWPTTFPTSTLGTPRYSLYATFGVTVQTLVPPVAGLTQSAAQTALALASLTVGTITTQSSTTVASGSVIAQNPVSGTSVLTGSAVALIISSGLPLAPVPNVVGQTQTVAVVTLTTASLLVGTVTTAPSSMMAIGLVVSQTPVAGASVLPGSAVALVLSSGPVLTTVPNVVGVSQTAAQTILTTAGLTLGTLTQQNDLQVAGLVLSQTPSAGTSIIVGSSVALVISRGPVQILVPNVVGQPQTTATTTLTTAGLLVGTVTTQQSATVPSGSVVSQVPPAGALVTPVSAVALVVSIGAPADASPVVKITTGTVTLRATATDDHGIVSVQFQVDGMNIGTPDTSSPYTKSWNSATVPNGSHTITAIARDTVGNTGSDSWEIIVKN